MNPTRLKILLGVVAVLVIALIWNWIAGWGLVTIHARSEPVSKIIRSIERQGGIRIVTNADLTSAISMDVDRVTPVAAVDVLAARLDGNWSVGYVAGPSKKEIAAGIAGIASGERNRDFRSFGFGGGFGGGGMELSSTPIDSRLVVWKVSPSDSPELQSYLDQLSQKTGLMAMVPESWNPKVPKTPKDDAAGAAMKAIIHSVNGESQEVFVIRISDRDRERTADAGQGPPQGTPRTDGGFGSRDGNDGRGPGGPGGWQGGGRGGFHPEWMAERAEARIAQLPVEEREQAKKDFDEMRAEMEKIRAITDDTQRRTAMENFFNQPAVQQRISERMADRDEKSGPERRAQRARDYIQRKQAMKNEPSND